MSPISEDTKRLILKKKPYLSLYFQEVHFSSICFELKQSGHTIPPIIYKKGEKSSYLSSRYNPQREVQAMLAGSGAKWQASEIIFILGIANLGIFPEVLARLADNQICIAIDAFYELGQLLCQQSPIMCDFLLRPGCHLFCGTSFKQSLQQYMESLPIDGLSGIKILRSYPSLRLDKEYYEQTEILIKDLVKARMSDLLTRLEFESLWVRNILINSRYLPPKEQSKTGWYTTKNYQGILQGIPGVLVAAGPSLQESFGHLHMLKKRAFILCVDSALKVLLHAGIVPHAVITLDAQIHTLFAFTGIDLSNILLFADLASNPSIFYKAKVKKVIFSTTAQISYDFQGSMSKECTRGTEFAEKIHGDVGYLQSGGSVATSAFDLLRTLGCDPIIFVGLDQAYTDRRIHSSGTYHTELWLTKLGRSSTIPGIIERIVRKRHTFLVPSIHGGDILTDHVLHLYKHWFENSLPYCSQKMYQFTARGALMAGVKSITDSRDVNHIISSFSQRDNLLELFSQTPELSIFKHPLFDELLKDLQKVTNTTKEKMTISALYERFPFLGFASRKAETYIKRNSNKLGIKEAEAVLKNKTLEILKILQRSLYPFAN